MLGLEQLLRLLILSRNSPFSARSDAAHGTTRRAHRWPGPIGTDMSTFSQMSLLREELLIVFILS